MMSMFISINEEGGWGTSNGIFECIVENTREMFSGEQKECVKAIYETLDEQGQTFIALDHVDVDCFNLFYHYCDAAMKIFPESERGKVPDPDYVPVILRDWEDFLRLMRDDPRYRPA